MKNYVMSSLELNLFFGRIMKEHAFFLLAGFPEKEVNYKNKAEWLREQFENVLKMTVELANGMVEEGILESGEIVTEFTEMAEKQTQRLTGIPIDIEITRAEKNLKANKNQMPGRETVQRVRRLNQRIRWLLNELIMFKEKILREVNSCNLYTTNYPLLIEHILREAKLYRQLLTNLERNGSMQIGSLKSTELFWNQIMMEHAQFIRGLLDPTECELMETADNFANDYCRLLEEARRQDCRAWEEMTQEAKELTEAYRDFKVVGTEGITGCEIRSIILPLLADHVLREANHYLRILEDSVAD
ncbi:MAG: DUF2935 domain-containing protein [Lachnospiraceae bacterium]|nr:DUF2935 domain-containing protein [Lachnospiraceae bacterium]